MNRTSVAAGLAPALAFMALAACGQGPPVPVDPAAGGTVAWDEPVRIASGQAYQGPWRMNRSDFRYVDDPTVAVSAAGVIAVTWADQAGKDLYIQVFEPGGGPRLDQPVNVSRSPDVFSWLPRMVVAGDHAERVYVLWQEILFTGGSHGGEILFARSTDGGRSFSQPVNLSNTTAGAGKGRLSRAYWHNGSLDLAQAPDGTLHAAWTEYEGPLYYSRSVDGGGNFSAPVRIAGDSRLPARGPSLAAGGNGNVYLAWTVGEDPAADIRVAVSDDSGKSFGKSRVIHPASGHTDGPKIAVDDEGTVHLVYAESAAGPLREYRILYTRSADHGAAFERPRDLSESHATRFASLNFPDLATSAEGRVYVLWQLYAAPAERPRGIGFTYSSDRGQTFAEPGIVPGTDDPALGVNGSRQGLLMNRVGVNAGGEIAVVHSTFRSGQASYIWLVRGRPDKNGRHPGP